MENMKEKNFYDMRSDMKNYEEKKVKKSALKQQQFERDDKKGDPNENGKS
jgi:hypothetical protein